MMFYPDNSDNTMWFSEAIGSYGGAGLRRHLPLERLRLGLALINLGVNQYILNQGKEYKLPASFNCREAGHFKRDCLIRAKGTG